MTATCSITVSAPTVTATATGDLTLGKSGDTITVTIDSGNDTFNTLSSADTSKFTVTVGGESLAVTDVSGSGTQATLTMDAPTQKGTVNVKVLKDAFQFEASADVEATSTGVTISSPTGNVNAELTGKLYAGTAASTQTIKLTIQEPKNGLTFNSDPSQDLFTLTGEGIVGSLKVKSATGSGDSVTLALEGTPEKNGSVNISVDPNAFKYPPTNSIPAGSVNVEEAPTVTLAQQGTVTAGASKEITINITDPTEVKFASAPDADNFTIDGLTVTDATITDDAAAKTVKLTLEAAPTTTDQLTVKVKAAAFTPVAAGETEVEITVGAPTGSVSGALAAGGSLTAGTNAAGVKITLTAGDDLRFQSSASQSDFTLNDGSEGLSIESVEVGSDGTTATLTLSGIPAKGGSFTVTALQAAFVASPGEDKTTTDSITIGYPSITLTVDPNYLAEEDDTVHAFTLKADGGTFKTPAVLGDFSFSGDITGITLNGVSADGDTATLTFTGSATSTGKLTITVKPTAFQYQPKSDVLAMVTVGQPSGTLSAAPNGTLYAGTAADGVTITVDITESQGLHFKQDMQPSDFTLTGSATGGLTIQKVEFVSTTQATLTLSGTPTTAGTFQVQAETGAFHMAPGAAITAEGDITVNAANVTITVDKNELQAGEADKTFSLNVTGAKFSSPSGKVSIDSQGSITSQLAVGQVTGGDASVTVTVTGKPDIAGDLTVKITKDAFEPQPDEDVTVTVPVAKGEQKQEQQTETGAPGIKSDTPLDKLAGAVLTPEELAKFNAGAEVIITLKEEALGDQVPADDKQAVEAVAAGYTVGDYLDVSLYKQINGGPETPVETTSSAIRVVFTIPENLRAANREYVVARVHDNTATILKPVAATDTTITVETNQFSTYAILYRTAVNTPTPTAAASDRAPDTGDDTLLPVWTVLLLGCGAALVPAVCVLRRRTHR